METIFIECLSSCRALDLYAELIKKSVTKIWKYYISASNCKVTVNPSLTEPNWMKLSKPVFCYCNPQSNLTQSIGPDPTQNVDLTRSNPSRMNPTHVKLYTGLAACRIFNASTFFLVLNQFSLIFCFIPWGKLRRLFVSYPVKSISQLRFDYDTITIQLRRKIGMFIFCSRRIASNGSRRAQYVVDRS